MERLWEIAHKYLAAFRDVGGLPEGVVPLLVITAFAVPVLVLLAPGWRRDDVRGAKRGEVKRELIFELRRRMMPTTAAELARHVKLDVFTTARVLEEMERDNLLESYTNTQRLTLWHLKGMPTRAVPPPELHVR